MARESMTDEQVGRWREVLDTVAGMLPDGGQCVLVDGARHADAVAGRLADHLNSRGRRHVRRQGDGDAEDRADIVIDLHDTDWPVIRRVVPRLAGRGDWYATESRAFFAPRAATWDDPARSASAGDRRRAPHVPSRNHGRPPVISISDSA